MILRFFFYNSRTLRLPNPPKTAPLKKKGETNTFPENFPIAGFFVANFPFWVCIALKKDCWHRVRECIGIEILWFPKSVALLDHFYRSRRVLSLRYSPNKCEMMFSMVILFGVSRRYPSRDRPTSTSQNHFSEPKIKKLPIIIYNYIYIYIRLRNPGTKTTLVGRRFVGVFPWEILGRVTSRPPTAGQPCTFGHHGFLAFQLWSCRLWRTWGPVGTLGGSSQV